MSKNKILYLVHRLPYPPNKGDKIASFNLLKYLAKDHEIYLGCFIDQAEDWQYIENLKAFCQDQCVVGLNPRLAKLKSLQGLWTGQPLSLTYYQNTQLQHWVDETLKQQDISAIVVFSGVMAQFVTPHLQSVQRSVLDLVDVDSDKWRLYAEDHVWPMSWLYRRESKTLLAFETQMAKLFDATVFVSEDEADYFKSLAPEVAEKVFYRVQGVDSQYFDPGLSFESPYQPDEIPVVFAGAMDYWPNIDAVVWFANEVFPKIKAEVAEARFYIVGMNPSEDVVKLAQKQGVVVTGSVPDVRPFIAHAKLSVAPLKIARGIQNKVLEAMAMAKPIVATPQAMRGIHIHTDYQPCITEAAEAFAQGVLDIIRKGDNQNAAAARDCILTSYNWDTNLKRIGDLLDCQ
jgi:sugar transferase (PEP-CTERM/EpsH1 system associated)